MRCELAQWADRTHCRRCGHVLPKPVVNIVDRVVAKVLFQQDPRCVQNLQEAAELISATAARLKESSASQPLPVRFNSLPVVEPFPTLEEMERVMIMAAYRRSNRRPVEAARLLGIGKTTFYRKLSELKKAAA
jgi:transcriptional regulator of acetoin/glycerol metabolism